VKTLRKRGKTWENVGKTWTPIVFGEFLNSGCPNLSKWQITNNQFFASPTCSAAKAFVIGEWRFVIGYFKNDNSPITNRQ
jgi:hypothetical protein